MGGRRNAIRLMGGTTDLDRGVDTGNSYGRIVG